MAYKLLYVLENGSGDLTVVLEKSKLRPRFREELMETHPEIMDDSKVNGSLNLKESVKEEISGLFIIHPIGSINTITYPILKKKIDWILESWPEIILIDMKQVSYVNLRGLRVVLKTIMEMNRRGGKVYLTNLQPEIKEMFDVMNDALPKWFFESRKQMAIYHDAIHKNCSGNRTKGCIRMGNFGFDVAGRSAALAL